MGDGTANRLRSRSGVGRCGFPRGEIDLGRHDDVIGEIGIFAVQCLAANDHELFLARDPPSRSKNVINLLLLHGGCRDFRLRQQTRRRASTRATSSQRRRAPASPRKARRLRHARRYPATRRRPIPRRPVASDEGWPGSGRDLVGVNRVNRKGDRPFELVQRLMRQAGARNRTDTARRHLEMIALADPPRLENRFRDNHAQRVSDASDGDLHGQVITCCHLRCNWPRMELRPVARACIAVSAHFCARMRCQQK